MIVFPLATDTMLAHSRRPWLRGHFQPPVGQRCRRRLRPDRREEVPLGEMSKADLEAGGVVPILIKRIT